MCTSFGHPSFVPSSQAGAKKQLAITMAIAGAKLWLEGVLSSRDLTNSVVKERAGCTPLSGKTETILGLWWEKGIEHPLAGNRVRLAPQ